MSQEFSFITPVLPDILAPQIIAGPGSANIESRTATIEWSTDELSISRIEYGERQKAGFIQYIETNWVIADHKVIVTGLNPNTVYDFRVISVDFSPLINEAVSRNKRFTKMAFNEDTIAPVLTSDPIVDKTDKTAIFEWDTDETSDSFIFIKIKDSNENFRKIGDDRKVTKHVVTVTNLIEGVNYEFELASRDLAGNIEGPTVIQKTSETISIQWKTDEHSDSFIGYGFDRVVWFTQR